MPYPNEAVRSSLGLVVQIEQKLWTGRLALRMETARRTVEQEGDCLAVLGHDKDEPGRRAMSAWAELSLGLLEVQVLRATDPFRVRTAERVALLVDCREESFRAVCGGCAVECWSRSTVAVLPGCCARVMAIWFWANEPSPVDTTRPGARQATANA